MFDKLINKEAKLAVIGLGYVGLPIALAFAKKIKVVGFDINQARVDMMRNQIDPSGELAKDKANDSAKRRSGERPEPSSIMLNVKANRMALC